MKYLFLFTFFLFGSNVYSQNKGNNKPDSLKQQSRKQSIPSKSETQEWIKEKIESFSSSYDDYKGYYGTTVYNVTFSDCEMTIKYTNNNSNNGFKSIITERTIIPIKELAKLNYKDVSAETVAIYFKTKTENSIIDTFDGETATKETVHEIRVGKSLLKDNLFQRLSNAFDNLVNLCGGKVTKEVF